MSRASLSDIEFSRNLPMRLNEKFYPLPKYNVVSPLVAPILFPESLLDDDISFDAEKRAIDQFFDAQQQKLREKEKISKIFGQQPSTSNETILKSVVINDNTAAAVSRRVFDPSAKRLFVTKGAESPLNNILQPTPVVAQNFSGNFNHSNNKSSSNNNANFGKPCTATLKKSKSTALVKLEDFELNQSSPFDTMELKTLNVFEELKQILSVSSSPTTEQKVESDRQRIT
uniref:Uncharacterized protein n=1 Tax=Romanomermis culicivorax TaxID=13658 RepID=A0A915KG61_ROMCU